MAQQGHVNLFVDYLNTLRTQTEAGNAFCFHEARGGWLAGSLTPQ